MDKFKSYYQPVLLISIFLLSVTSLLLSVSALKGHRRHWRGHQGGFPHHAKMIDEKQREAFHECLKAKGVKKGPRPEMREAFQACFKQATGKDMEEPKE